MRKSSFGQYNGRLSSGPLRVKNDGGGGARKSGMGSITPQAKRDSSASGFSSASSSRSRSTMGLGLGRRATSTVVRSSGIGARNSGIGIRGAGAGGIGARNSGIGLRGSGVGVRSRSDVPKDPRPISDKGFQHRCIRTLVDFLTEYKYPHLITPKLLQSPPSKDFFKIFEFIYCQLDPAFKLGGKMEEEVPRVLKMMGYPFSISKSSMHAVGTPHTWPTLLAALVWLVDLVKFTNNLSGPQLDHLIFTPNDDDFDSMPDDKIKFQYISQAYNAYLAGADEYDDLDEELGKVLEDKYLGQSGGMDALRNENARVAEEIELLDQEVSRVDKLQEQKEIMLLDERKFQDYLAELENARRKHQQLLHKADEDHASLEQELKSVVTKNQHMQAIYEQQDLSLADVERLRASRQELQRVEEGLERELEGIDADIWKEEMGLARLREKMDASLAEYSRLARALKLIPSSTDVANGIDFELRSNDPEFSHKFEKIIKPSLMAMKSKAREAIQQADSKKLQEERRLEQLKEQIGELEEEIKQLEKGIKHSDEELESRKQLYQRDTDDLQGTVDRMRQEILSLQTSSQMNLQDAERELRETCSWAEQKKMELLKTEKDYTLFLSDVCMLVTEHKSHIQDRLRMMEREMKQMVSTEQDRSDRMDISSQQLRAQLHHP